MPYDPENIFAKIIRQEIPCEKVYEDNTTIAFKDINPQARVHLLVIPKGSYVSWDDFTQKATNDEIATFIKSIGKITRQLGLAKSGYRIITNHGENAHQEVPHFHIHILAGNDLGNGLLPKN